MPTTGNVTSLFQKLEELYLTRREELLFHGWHHIVFVRNKALGFAESNGADAFFVESAALVHDLNYFLEHFSEPSVAEEFRSELLSSVGYSPAEIERIESIINEAHTKTRGEDISPEGEALSDGDTLFKSLPITLVLFASKYLEQNKIDIATLAEKIVSEQKPLLESGIYFYTPAAKTYLKWAEVNLQLWENIHSCLQEKDVSELLRLAMELGVVTDFK